LPDFVPRKVERCAFAARQLLAHEHEAEAMTLDHRLAQILPPLAVVLGAVATFISFAVYLE
jgi:hypothetical protein